MLYTSRTLKKSKKNSFQWHFKWNKSIVGTGSGKNGATHGSEPLSSPALVVQSAGIWRIVAEKCTCAPWTFPFKLARTSCFGPARKGECKATLKNAEHCSGF